MAEDKKETSEVKEEDKKETAPKKKKKKKKKKPPKLPIYMELTDKQKKFADEILSGKTREEAYRAAYNCDNMAAPTVRRRAQEVVVNPKVVKYMKEIEQRFATETYLEVKYGRNELLNDFFYMRDKAKESMEQNGVRQASSNAYINSLKNIGDLLGLYPDKKIDVNANIVNTNFEINIVGEEPEEDNIVESECKVVDDENVAGLIEDILEEVPDEE